MEIIAHRGVHDARTQENTIAAFQKAVNLGCSMMELDCRLTKDQKLVVTHGGWDVYENRVIWVKDFTLDELVAMKVVTNSIENCIYPKRQMPTLELVLKNFLGKIKINIELKDKFSESILFADLWIYDSLRNLVVSSPLFKEVASFKPFYSDLATVIIWDGFSVFPAWKIFSLGCGIRMFKHRIDGIDINIRAATEKTVSYFKKRGLAVRVYVVNNTRIPFLASLQDLYNWGVDGIYTDRVEFMREELAKIKNKTA